MNVPIRKGGVYWIPDTAVGLPPTAAKDRLQHPKRPFLLETARIGSGFAVGSSVPAVAGPALADESADDDGDVVGGVIVTSSDGLGRTLGP